MSLTFHGFSVPFRFPVSFTRAAWSPESHPLRFPMGVRVASTMTASDISLQFNGAGDVVTDSI